MYIAKLSTVHKMNEIATETGLRIQLVLKVYMEEVCCFIYNFKNYSFIYYFINVSVFLYLSTLYHMYAVSLGPEEGGESPETGV